MQIMWLSVLLPMGTALELSQEWMEFGGVFRISWIFSLGKIWQVVSVSQDLDVNYVAEMLDKLQDPGGLGIVLKFPSFSKASPMACVDVCQLIDLTKRLVLGFREAAELHHTPTFSR